MYPFTFEEQKLSSKITEERREERGGEGRGGMKEGIKKENIDVG